MYLAPGSDLMVVSDSDLCVAGVARRQACGDNWDLWARLWELVRSKRIRLSAKWVKAHGDTHTP